MNNKKFIALFIALSVCIFIFGLKIFGVVTDSKSEKVYFQGLQFFNAKDYQNAYYNFNKISILSNFSSVALFRQASCAWELKDRKTASRKYSKFAKMYKNTDLAAIALWRIVLISFDRHDIKKAKKILYKIRDKYPDTDFAKAASYQLAYILFEKDKEKAKPYLLEYIEYAPLGKYSYKSLNMLDAYKKDELLPGERFLLAKAYYENGLNNKALEELKLIPVNYSWSLQAKIYDKFADYSALGDVLLKGVTLKRQPVNIEDKDVLDLMALYVKKSGLPSLEAAKKLVIATKNNSYYPLALFVYSKYVKDAVAVQNYSQIYNSYPNSIVAPDALWLNFWFLYKVGKLNEAVQLSKRYTNLYLDDNIQPKIMFWSAKIHLMRNQKSIARNILQNIVRNFPYSYYAFRANALLKGVHDPWGADSSDTLKAANFNPAFPLTEKNKENRILKKFVDLGDYDAISDFKIDNNFLNSWIFAMRGNRSYSVLLARDAIKENNGRVSFESPKAKLAYPLYYREFVAQNADKNNVNPYLVYALMREESFFNPKALSSTGARGLMQLMPATAAMTAKNFKGADALYDPAYNISLGVKYFAYLIREFKGNKALAVLAYNSGPGSVNGWLATMGDREFDEFIEDIPYPETANYVKKVYAAYWCYKKIYDRI